jgi:hypothetical protein
MFFMLLNTVQLSLNYLRPIRTSFRYTIIDDRYKYYSRARRRLTNLGITYKGGLIAKAQTGFIKNLNAIARRVSALRVGAFEERIAIGMITAEYLPYEASQTYRSIKSELEYQRSKALVEAHSQTYRR